MKGEVKERGMIFNDEMVRAILGGNKTQTRRIVEEKFYGRAVAAELLAKHCPYGQPGDRIWVRETYRVHGKATDVATLVSCASPISCVISLSSMLRALGIGFSSGTTGTGGAA